MKDRIDLVFNGGLIIRPSGKFNQKALDRAMRQLSARNKLPFSGHHIVINSIRSQRRAKGAGISEGAIISKRLQKTLVAAGLSRSEAATLTWESAW